MMCSRGGLKLGRALSDEGAHLFFRVGPDAPAIFEPFYKLGIADRGLTEISFTHAGTGKE